MMLCYVVYFYLQCYRPCAHRIQLTAENVTDCAHAFSRLSAVVDLAGPSQYDLGHVSRTRALVLADERQKTVNYSVRVKRW